MSGKRALIVDDEEVNCQLLEMVLEDDYEVESVNSGEGCLRSVAACPPDIVLLDVNMPGMTGIEVCRELKASAETRSIPVVFVTALDNRDIRDEVKGVGGSGLITKPIDPDTLVESVRLLLEGQV